MEQPNQVRNCSCVADDVGHANGITSARALETARELLRDVMVSYEGRGFVRPDAGGDYEPCHVFVLQGEGCATRVFVSVATGDVVSTEPLDSAAHVDVSGSTLENSANQGRNVTFSPEQADAGALKESTSDVFDELIQDYEETGR